MAAVTLAAALGVFYLLPGLFEQNAESRLRQTIRQMSADGIPVTLDGYAGGWFSSDATTSLPFNGGRLRLIHRIWHGPFVAHAGWESILPVAAVVSTSVELPENIDPRTRKLLQELSLSIESAVSLAGAVDTRVSLAPFAYREDQATLSSKGVTADFYLGSDLREVSSVIQVEDASVRAPDGHVAVAGFEFHGHAYRNATGIWLGNSSLRIRQLGYAGGPDETSVNNFSFTLAAGTSQGLLAHFYPSSDLREVSSAIEVEDMSIRARDVHAAVAGLEFHGDAYRDSTGIWLGNSGLRIRQLDWAGSPNETSTNNLSFAASADLKQGVLDLTSQLAADSVRLPDNELKAANIGIDLNNISPEVGVKLAAIVKLTGQSRVIPYSNPWMRAQLLHQDFGELLAALFKRPPKFSLNSHVSFPEGDAQAAVEATIDEAFAHDLSSIPGGANNPALVQSLFGCYLSVSGFLGLPASLIARLASDDDRRRLVERGVLAPNGDRYVCNFNYSRSELTVNGRKMAPADLVVPNLRGADDKANRVKAQADIAELKTALDRYYLDNGYYPSTDQGLNALVTPPTNGRVPSNYESGGYIERLPMDPWGTAYFYQSDGNSYVLKSFGPDGVESSDDIE